MKFVKQRERKNFTRREAPYFDGYYAVQGLPKDARNLTLTSYRKTLEGANEQREAFSKSGLWERVALRAGYRSWDVFGPDGDLECLCTEISTHDIPDLTRAENIDYDKLDADVSALVGRKCHRIASQACHAGTSVRSVQDFRRAWITLMGKETEGGVSNDKYLFMAEPGNYDCRVITLYADFAGKLLSRVNSVEESRIRRGVDLTEEMSDERAGQLHRTGADLLNAWADIRHAIASESLCPMFSDGWYDEMKSSLVWARRDYLRQIFVEAVNALDAKESRLLLFDITLRDNDAFREMLARALLQQFGKAFCHEPGRPEFIQVPVILANATELVALLESTWATWRGARKKVIAAV